MILSQEEFDSVKWLRWVVIKVDALFQESHNGIVLPQHQTLIAETVTHKGTVVKMPIHQLLEENKNQLLPRTEMEISIGNTVYFGLNLFMEIKERRFLQDSETIIKIENSEDVYFAIDYREIMGASNENSLWGCNGWVLGHRMAKGGFIPKLIHVPTSNPVKRDNETVEQFTQRLIGEEIIKLKSGNVEWNNTDDEYADRLLVVAPPMSIPEHSIGELIPSTETKVGDIVTFPDHQLFKIHNELTDDNKLYAVHNRQISGFI